MKRTFHAYEKLLKDTHPGEVTVAMLKGEGGPIVFRETISRSAGFDQAELMRPAMHREFRTAELQLCPASESIARQELLSGVSL